MGIQTQIRSAAPAMPPSARRIADLILTDPRAPLNHTIGDMARRASTSEPSVVRFCRALGLSGYSQLRLVLATELGEESVRYGPEGAHGSDITPTDSLAAVVSKIAAQEMMGIEETTRELDLGSLENASRAIDASNKVLCFGIGASQSSATDLQHKLFRIGRTAFSVADSHEALVGAALMRAGDVAVGLSHSGRTKETTDFVELAGLRGATTVAVTNTRESRLAEIADVVLYTAVRETTFRSAAMASRIAQLTVVDCLFTAVAQRRYAQTVEALTDTYQVLEAYRRPIKR